MSGTHDAHARPPEFLRELFKTLRKCSPSELPSLVDTWINGTPGGQGLRQVANTEGFDASRCDETLQAFSQAVAQATSCCLPNIPLETTKPIFEIPSLPGLYLFPALLTPQVQVALLERLLHRDLSNPIHNTNIDLHFNLRDLKHTPLPSNGSNEDSNSFFSISQETFVAPHDATIHKPITIKQLLESKLRWVTLGGQYDWTNKTYPSEPPPGFPQDIATLMQGLFPNVDAQAAIVNFYSPGDTLSVHRDVSEECDNGLISASIGCDCIFMIGNQNGSSASAVRLRSGDVLLMSGESRFAWHAVPKIVADTCPSWLEDWPVIDKTAREHYLGWRGWIRNKRINLNIRQMHQTRQRPHAGHIELGSS